MKSSLLNLLLSILIISYGLNLIAQETILISDEMTVDVDQNKNWRMGSSNYPIKPNHAWELGLNI